MVAGRRTGPGRWRRAVSQSRIQAMQRGQLLSLAPHAGVQLATHALRLERAHQGSVAAWALRAAWPSGPARGVRRHRRQRELISLGAVGQRLLHRAKRALRLEGGAVGERGAPTVGRAGPP